MVFCNTEVVDEVFNCPLCHNPYFNRWFSAITITIKHPKTGKNVTILILIDGFLQYNPSVTFQPSLLSVTILILIDGFLQ